MTERTADRKISRRELLTDLLVIGTVAVGAYSLGFDIGRKSTRGAGEVALDPPPTLWVLLLLRTLQT